MAKRQITPKAKPALKVVIPVTQAEYAGLSKNQIITELTKSPHGALTEYTRIGLVAAKEDEDFFSHLIAWNHLKGQVRDAKKALPVLALGGTQDPELQENALALLADLDPRNFLKALQFSREVKAPQRPLRRLVERYLRDLEGNWGQWERTAVQHRQSLHALYATYHIKPVEYADRILFKGQYAPGTRFHALSQLKQLTPEQIAGTIMQYKLPFLIARAALGPRAKEPDVLVALIARMTPTELVTNMKGLERLGVKDVPAARAALEKALEGAASSKKPARATLKTTKAAEVLEEEGETKLASKLRVLQEKQLDNLGGIEGNWLVLGDVSGSMVDAIEPTRLVAGTLARLVKGHVLLGFFNTTPTFYEVTATTLEKIKEITKRVRAGGGTSYGCGIRAAQDKRAQFDGVVFVGDGEDVASDFAATWKTYCATLGIEPTLYFYWIRGNGAFLSSCKANNIDVQVFDLRGGVDYYSLPNLVQTMRVGRFQLLDEIMQTPLVQLDDVLDKSKGFEVVKGLVTA